MSQLPQVIKHGNLSLALDLMCLTLHSFAQSFVHPKREQIAYRA